MKGRFVGTGFEGLVGGQSLALHLGSETGIRRNRREIGFVPSRICISVVGGCWTLGNVRLLVLPYDGSQEVQGGDASRGGSRCTRWFSVSDT